MALVDDSHGIPALRGILVSLWTERVCGAQGGGRLGPSSPSLPSSPCYSWEIALLRLPSVVSQLFLALESHSGGDSPIQRLGALCLLLSGIRQSVLWMRRPLGLPALGPVSHTAYPSTSSCPWSQPPSLSHPSPSPVSPCSFSPAFSPPDPLHPSCQTPPFRCSSSSSCSALLRPTSPAPISSPVLNSCLGEQWCY